MTKTLFGKPGLEAKERWPSVLLESDGGVVSELWRLPLHGCWVNRNLDQTGRAFVYLNRRLMTGGVVGAGFLIDVRGVGIKDCFQTRDVPVSELESVGAAKFFGGRPAECPEHRARQLVWGGCRRALAMGFRLPGQFWYCSDLLQRLDEIEIDPELFRLEASRLSSQTCAAGKQLGVPAPPSSPAHRRPS